MSKRHFSLLLSLVLMSGAANAETIDSLQARSIVNAFLTKDTGDQSSRHRMKADESVDLARVSAGYYAYNVGGDHGFVLVASDDAYPNQILAYSDEGAFDYDNMPENARMWISQYDAEMQALKANPSMRRNAPAKTRTNIPYLLTTRWGQGEPFYNMCPTKVNDNGVLQHCVTGCTATSLAQVMNYHKWPKAGTGTSGSYDYAHTYDWDNMADNYVYYYDDNGVCRNASYTTAQANAVAQLMRDCGAACGAGYGLSETGGLCENAIDKLKSNLGYSADIRKLSRGYYTAEEWLDVIHNELANGRPILYNGWSSDSGHAFICDGYMDGLIHMNWGWSGHYDGYFCVGAFTTGYNNKSTILAGVEPAKSVQTYEPTLEMGGFPYTSDAESITVNVYGLVNRGNRTETGDLGLKIVSETGDVTYCVSTNSTNPISLKPNAVSADSRKWPIKVAFANMMTSDGIYYITPAYRSPEGEWYDIQFPKFDSYGSVNLSYPIKESIKVVKNGDNITLADKTITSNISAEVVGQKQFVQGAEVTLTCKLTATDDYMGFVTAAYISSTNSTYVRFNNTKYTVSMKKGESKIVSMVIPAQESVGSYNVLVADCNYTVISDATTIEILDKLEESIVAYPPIITNSTAVTKDDKVTAVVMPVNKADAVYVNLIYFYAFNEDYEDVTPVSYIYAKNLNGDYTVLTNNEYNTMELGAARHRIATKMPDGTIFKSAIYYKDMIKEERISDFTYYRTSGNKTVTFTMSAANWSTLMLPFEAMIPEGLAFLEITGNEQNELTLKVASYIKANTPYLVYGTPGDYSFTGTPTGNVVASYTSGVLTGAMYSHHVTGNNFFVLQKKQSGLGFYRVGANDIKIPMYRCYLDVKDAENTTFFPLDIDMVTGIKDAAQGSTDASIYNIMGNKISADDVNALPKGIYIVNGKKVMVK